MATCVRVNANLSHGARDLFIYFSEARFYRRPDSRTTCMSARKIVEEHRCVDLSFSLWIMSQGRWLGCKPVSYDAPEGFLPDMSRFMIYHLLLLTRRKTPIGASPSSARLAPLPNAPDRVRVSPSLSRAVSDRYNTANRSWSRLLAS
jgi:hypothetical protein